MNKSVTYIVGATVLVGGAYLFLKNKKEKDLSKLAELGGTTPSGTTPSGATPSGTTPSGITPNITEPVKIDKDVNLDAYNIQQLLEQLKELENKRKNPPRKENASGVTTNEYWNWYFSVGRQAEYDKKRQPILEKLAKLGYKFENGLLIKI
jgi:hypothetical protein